MAIVLLIKQIKIIPNTNPIRNIMGMEVILTEIVNNKTTINKILKVILLIF